MTQAEALEILQDKSYRKTHAQVQEAIAVLVALINTPPQRRKESGINVKKNCTTM